MVFYSDRHESSFYYTNNHFKMDSKPFLCCTTKTWSLFIGWTQTILCGIGVAVFFVSFLFFVVEFSADDDETITSIDNYVYNNATGVYSNTTIDTNQLNTLVVTSMLIAIGTLVIGLAAGIILIIGVTKRNFRKLRIWTIIQIIYLLFSLANFILNILTEIEFYGLIRDVLTIFFGAFCIWIVNVHRREIITYTVGSVIYAGRRY